jgi:hypothetical protein
MPKVFFVSDCQFTEILKILPGCVGDAFESKLYPWMVNNAEVFLLLFIVNDEVDFLPWRLCRSLSKFFFSSTRNLGGVVEHLVRIFLFVGQLSLTVRSGTWGSDWRDSEIIYCYIDQQKDDVVVLSAQCFLPVRNQSLTNWTYSLSPWNTGSVTWRRVHQVQFSYSSLVKEKIIQPKIQRHHFSDLQLNNLWTDQRWREPFDTFKIVRCEEVGDEGQLTL